MRAGDGMCQDHSTCWSDLDELKLQTGALSSELTAPSSELLFCVSKGPTIRSRRHGQLAKRLLLERGRVIFLDKGSVSVDRQSWVWKLKSAALASYGCCNKSPQTWWHKPTQIYYLTVLQVRIPAWISPGLDHRIGWAGPFWRL